MRRVGGETQWTVLNFPRDFSLEWFTIFDWIGDLAVFCRVSAQVMVYNSIRCNDDCHFRRSGYYEPCFDLLFDGI
jgi:hypothetical protein